MFHKLTSKQTATTNQWLAGDYYGSNGAIQVVNTAGATWAVTGVQLESGSVATPFEFRHYGTELNLCKRYYQTGRMTCQTLSEGSTGATYKVYVNEIGRAHV